VSNLHVDQILPDEGLTDGELCCCYQCKVTQRIAAITENNTPAKVSSAITISRIEDADFRKSAGGFSFDSGH
jgi:hypothetical protein